MHFLNLLGMLTLLSVAIAAQSLNSTRNEKYPATPAELRTAQASTSNGLYLFTRRLIKELVQIDSLGFAVSPIGIFLDLSVQSYAAGGNLKSDLKWKLSRPVYDEDLRKIGSQKLVDDLANYTGLRVTNSFFAAPTVQLRPEFIDLVERTFRLVVRNVSFEKSMETNNVMIWRTNNKNIADKWVVSMKNTVSFNGTWMKKFDTSKTQNRKFYSSDGTEKQLPTMSISGHFRYGDYPEATFVELPFENQLDHAQKISMFIILPKERDLVNFRTNFHKIVSRNLFGDGKLEEIHIQLPRFEFASDSDLKDPLTRMELGGMFDPSTANFSDGIVNSTGYITGFVQDNVVRVTEEGVAAVSAIASFNEDFETPSIPENAPLLAAEPVNNLTHFIADHTFCAVIAATTNRYAMNLMTVYFDG